MTSQENTTKESSRRGLLSLGGSGLVALLASGCMNNLGDEELGSVALALSNSQLDAFENLSDLYSLVPTGTQPEAYIVLGHSQPNDGGGGVFYWDASSSANHDGATVVLPTGHSGNGRWLRVWDHQNVNVRWFGALATGADESAQLQAAVDACPFGGTVIFPAGQYSVGTSLDLSWPNAASVRLQGGAGRQGEYANTGINWCGTTTDPIINLHSRNCKIDGFQFKCESGSHTVAAIDMDRPNAEQVTANHIENCEFVSFESHPQWGPMDYGIRIAQVGNGNIDHTNISRCSFKDLSCAGVYIGNSDNTKHHVLEHCSFNGGQFGIQHIKGSFRCSNGSFNNVTDAAISLGTLRDFVRLDGIASEGCNRFLVATADSKIALPVTVTNGRFDCSAMASDGEYIRFLLGGPLIIEGCYFENYSDSFVRNNFKILVGTQHWTYQGSQGTTFVSRGNVFPNRNPYKAAVLHSAIRLYSFGNVTYDFGADGGWNTSDDLVVHIPDVLGLHRELHALSSPNDGAGLRLIGQGLSLGVKTVNSSAVLDGSHCVVRANAAVGALVVTLPDGDATSDGRMFVVKKVDSSAYVVTVVPGGSDTIDGSTAGYLLSGQNEYVRVVCDAQGNWMVVGYG